MTLIFQDECIDTASFTILLALRTYKHALTSHLCVRAVAAENDGLHKELQALLLEHFGHTSFRGLQLPAIEAVLQGNLFNAFL